MIGHLWIAQRGQDMKMRNVTVAGAGVLGSQVAWQAAFRGFNVTVYDAFDKGLEVGRELHDRYARLFNDTRGVPAGQIDQTFSRLRYTTDLAEAVADADITSESVPENLAIKQAFYGELGQLAPGRTIFTTNSSTMVPSQMAAYTGRPERFLALHFANIIWDHNIGEVMGHPDTDSDVFQQVIDFARGLGMVPIPIHKEQHGYIINSLLVPFLSAAQDLLVRGVTDHESIDRTWMIAMGSPFGPCGLMDTIGMETIMNVLQLRAAGGEPGIDERIAWFKKHFLDHNRLGVKTGEGFYSYPDPAFQQPDFLK